MKAQLNAGWEVEWCKKVPTFSDGSADMDNAEYVIHELPTREAAVAKAKEVLPQDAFGSVRVTEFVYEAPDPDMPWHKTKEFVGDPKHIEA